MADSRQPVDDELTKSVLARAVERTPNWVWAFGGVQVVTSICLVATLQLTGFASPLQRVVNAKAAEIEQASQMMNRGAAAMQNAAVSMEAVVAKLDDHEERIKKLEQRMNDTDRKYHTP